MRLSISILGIGVGGCEGEITSSLGGMSVEGVATETHISLPHSHSNQDGLTGARKLCESLIDAVQKEFENWNKSQQPLGFGGTAPGYGPCECLPPICLPVCLSVSVRRFKKASRFAVLLVLLLASDSN